MPRLVAPRCPAPAPAEAAGWRSGPEGRSEAPKSRAEALTSRACRDSEIGGSRGRVPGSAGRPPGLACRGRARWLAAWHPFSPSGGTGGLASAKRQAAPSRGSPAPFIPLPLPHPHPPTALLPHFPHPPPLGSMADLEYAKDRIMMGAERKSAVGPAPAPALPRTRTRQPRRPLAGGLPRRGLEHLSLARARSHSLIARARTLRADARAGGWMGGWGRVRAV